MRVCNTCGVERADNVSRCRCGNYAYSYAPQPHEIAAAMEQIRNSWSAAVELSRRSWDEIPADVTVCRRHPRGRRVMRDTEDK